MSRGRLEGATTLHNSFATTSTSDELASRRRPNSMEKVSMFSGQNSTNRPVRIKSSSIARKYSQYGVCTEAPPDKRHQKTSIPVVTLSHSPAPLSSVLCHITSGGDT